MPISVICDTCFKTFKVPPSHFKYGNPRFCSKKCFYKWLKGSERAPRVVVPCPACGKKLRMLKSRFKDGRQHFCSKQCAHLGRKKNPRTVSKIPRKCRECDKVFFLYPSQITGNRGRFCSRQCVIAHTNKRMRKKRPTTIERMLIDELNVRNVPFETNFSVPPWNIDIAFPKSKIAVEADGIYWHNLDHVKEKDARKDQDLESQGWVVLHFTGDQIRQSHSACVDKIIEYLS